MGSVKVTVYGRVKPCLKNSGSLEYHLKNGENEDQITFASTKIPTGKKTYRFKKIFTENATQEDIFETVAKPIIKSVLTGYNGTIFTYGQTGSGKTYTMTGDIEGWLNPGLIPRTVQEIFRQKTRDTPITITYCEIYNEHVYDLIRVDRVDPDLPQVSLLEDSTGITHFRNLSVHLVGSAFEALQLLIRGDANKMVAETPGNARSSRSHVIFSIGLEFPHPTEEKLCLKPVLYLVDLAGSEKLSKCKTPMNNALETRYINLSLHYLEQVLIALRQPGRNHIPYRNSLMTALLRNSLGGNCITAMIATFSLSLDDLEETFQTCRFAERIALIKNEVKLNELINPQKEILLLRRENDKLRTQLRMMSLPQTQEELSDKDRGKCEEMVKSFIRGNDIFDLPLSNIKKIECCFQLMRHEILKKAAQEPIVKNLEKRNNVPDALKDKSSSTLRNYQFQPKLDSESRVKFLETNGGRKRNPIDLPKINLTYKRWKSTEEITDAEQTTFRKFSSKELKELKELKVVQSNLSDSSIPSDKLQEMISDPSLNSSAAEITPQLNKKPPATYVMENCFLNVTGSGALSKYENSTACLKFQDIVETKTMNTKVSNFGMKTDFLGTITGVTSQSPLSSKEAFSYGEFKKLISIGIQVEDNMAREIESTGAISSNSNVIDSNSTYSLETGLPGKSLPLTGDKEVDAEILKFYRARYESLKKK